MTNSLTTEMFSSWDKNILAMLNTDGHAQVLEDF